MYGVGNRYGLGNMYGWEGIQRDEEHVQGGQSVRLGNMYRWAIYAGDTNVDVTPDLIHIDVTPANVTLVEVTPANVTGGTFTCFSFCRLNICIWHMQHACNMTGLKLKCLIRCCAAGV
jgi:hypothetical protein